MKIPATLWLACLFLACLLASPPAAVDPSSPETLIETGHFKRARAPVEPAYRSHPNDARLAHLLSRIRLAFGDSRGAIELADKAVHLDPSKAEYHIHYAHIYGRMLDDASAAGKIKIVGHFRRELEAALAINPTQIDALLMKAIYLANAPGLIGGDRKKAEEIVQGLVHIDAEHGSLGVARYAQDRGDWGRMDRAYHSALAANPQSYAALYGLAYLYCCQTGRPDWVASEQWARRAMQADPTQIGSYKVLARVEAAEEHWAELDTLMTSSDRNIPDDLGPYFAAGKLLAESGKDLPRAERYMQKYLTQEPEGEEPSRGAAEQELVIIRQKMGYNQRSG